MADKTSIEWTRGDDGTPGATWNPVTGCTKVSDGCTNCYAERITNRFGGKGAFDTVVLHPDRLDAPLRWRKPRRVFVNSMSDLFHADVPDDYIARVFAVMAATPRHTYQVLTKRHARMRTLVGDADFQRELSRHLMFSMTSRSAPWPLPNVWLGVSVENQQWADIRIPVLADTPAAVRFLSCEPLLGRVDLTAIPLDRNRPGAATPPQWNHVIHWLIAGGESGPNARPMHPDWVHALRYDCQYPNIGPRVPFFLKQWGEWAPAFPWHDDKGYDKSLAVVETDGSYKPWRRGLYPTHGSGAVYMRRVGKKAAGRELDWREWNEYPQAVT